MKSVKNKSYSYTDTFQIQCSKGTILKRTVIVKHSSHQSYGVGVGSRSAEAPNNSNGQQLVPKSWKSAKCVLGLYWWMPAQSFWNFFVNK